jgi:hypothetical protein
MERCIFLSKSKRAIKNDLRKSTGQVVLFSVKTKRKEFLQIHTAIWLWKLEWNSALPVPRAKTTLLS